MRLALRYLAGGEAGTGYGQLAEGHGLTSRGGSPRGSPGVSPGGSPRGGMVSQRGAKLLSGRALSPPPLASLAVATSCYPARVASSSTRSASGAHRASPSSASASASAVPDVTAGEVRAFWLVCSVAEDVLPEHFSGDPTLASIDGECHLFCFSLFHTYTCLCSLLVSSFVSERLPRARPRALPRDHVAHRLAAPRGARATAVSICAAAARRRGTLP